MGEHSRLGGVRRSAVVDRWFRWEGAGEYGRAKERGKVVDYVESSAKP